LNVLGFLIPARRMILLCFLVPLLGRIDC